VTFEKTKASPSTPNKVPETDQVGISLGERSHAVCKTGAQIHRTADVSAETFQTKREWKDIFIELRKIQNKPSKNKTCMSRILYTQLSYSSEMKAKDIT
jgi:hypothetical protein